jgi:formylglycine-generating enzyme required for sulfatase activity
VGRLAALRSLRALAFVAFACPAACATAPAPLGEVLLVVQTDVAIPRRVNRLRVDVYGTDGALLDSRELDAPSLRDWPISFSIVADREEERQVVVRLRAYPEGHVITHAELEAMRTNVSAQPVVYGTLEDACSAAPTLQLGRPITLRRGSRPLTTVVPYVDGSGVASCTQPTLAGSVAARLVVTEKATYKVEVVSAIPDGARGEPGGDTTLALRADCNLATTELACNDDAIAGSRLSAVTRDLDPGTYWVVTGGAEPAPADLTLLATELDAAVAIPTPPPPVADPGAVVPSPGATIDRLVRLRLRPGDRGTVPVTLFGECFGTPADVATGQTCVDRAGVVTPVDTIFSRGALRREGAPPPPPWNGDDEAPCTATPRPTSTMLDDEVCIPGGALLLGDTLGLTDLDYRTQPERMRVVAPFLLDVHEMTVGRFRDAIRRGLVPLANGVDRNDGVITKGPPANVCTWSEGATADVPAAAVGDTRESFPLNCVTWAQARAVCNFFGGDLPTEDQWEYAATAAGRTAETQYPWGDDLPTCERAVVERSNGVLANRCAKDFGPVAVDDLDYAKSDVTSLGVIGLGGNVMEWLATGFYPYAGAAWTRAGLRDPLPAWADDEAPLRATRGGDWAQYALFATASARRAEPVLSHYDNVGFRCARPGR